MKKLGAFLLLFALMSTVTITAAAADGTETLGDPSVPILAGSGVAVAGTGLVNQPGTITIDVPAGATIQQTLLYWNGFHSNEAFGDDDTISVNGTSITGTLIGGPIWFFGTSSFNRHVSSTYRADITALGLIGAGTTSVTVSDMDFDRDNNGAGIAVIWSDGSVSEISLVDGNDPAASSFGPERGVTTPQTFTFAAEAVDRVADLNMFYSSVEGQDIPGMRPSVLRVTVDGVVTELADILISADGDEWDTVSVPVAIPAGITTVTVQAFSEDINSSGNLPASLVWNMASLTVPVTPTEPPPPLDWKCKTWRVTVFEKGWGDSADFEVPVSITHPLYPDRNFADEAGFLWTGEDEWGTPRWRWGIREGLRYAARNGVFTVEFADGTTQELTCKVRWSRYRSWGWCPWQHRW